MLSTTLAKAAGLLVFLAVIGGATYGVQSYLGDSVGGQLVNAEPVRAQLNATPGNTVTYAITIQNRGSDPLDAMASLQGEGIDARSSLVTVAAGKTRTVFVPVEVGADVTTDRALTLRILDAEGESLREKADSLQLRVLGDAPAFAPGDNAQVAYTGRLSSSGGVFTTNDQALAGKTFSTVQGYNPREVLRPRPTDLPGFRDALVGMKGGESRTVTIPAQAAYGNATAEETVDRQTLIQREEAFPLPTVRLTLDNFDAYLNQTSQGTAAEKSVGDVIVNEREGETLRYRISEKTEQGVVLRLAVEPGETYTVYEFWPNASAVVSANDTHAVFRTTPTQDVGATMDYYTYWPQMTKLDSVNETEIVLTHTPRVGMQYTLPQGASVVSYTVREVNDDVIVVSRPSGVKYAGEELVFDILVLDLVKAPSQG